MAFVKAMSANPLTKKGVNGSDVYTDEGLGNDLVALFTQLVRKQDEMYIIETVKKVLKSNNPQTIIDLFVMAFQTRNIRGGKGERKLFLYFMQTLLNHFPQWSYSILSLVPEYGCWNDLWKMYSFFNKETQNALDQIVKERFELDQESEKPSLLAKWLPREGSKHDYLARNFARLLFPLTPHSLVMRRYRKTVAYLNRLIDTTEIKMCGKKWSTITPSHVPGRLMKKNKLAFLNQKKAKDGEVETRHLFLEDRIECASHFVEFLNDVKKGTQTMKGAHTTMPHEHVHELLQRSGHSKEEVDVIQAQWDSIRNECEKGGNLGKIVPMCDFSGSMSGEPKEVCLALGILISELTSPAFKDHILTFDEEPRWFSFSNMKTLQEKIKSIKSFVIGQGLNTNIDAAIKLILRRLVEHKVSPEDAPTDLLILTDMGFDAASHIPDEKWSPHFARIRSEFETLGYIPPRIVCWNLRGEFKEYHATAHEEGVVQLSGWSPSLFKVLQDKGITVKTPYEGMRSVLDDPIYEPVRNVVKNLLKEKSSDILYSS